MLTTRTELTACVSMSQHSLMKSRCALASCRAGLWSSFKHLAGFLKLKRMPRKSSLTQVVPGRTSSPSASSHSSTKPWIVTTLTHRTSVTFMMCSLGASCLRASAKSSCQAALLVARSASSDKECSGRCRRTLRGTGAGPRTKAPPHVPPLGLPRVQHVKEPVAGDEVDVDLAALRRTAAGLVFGRGGRSSTRRLDVGELLVCERLVDGFAWSPPGRVLQADALRELVVVHDVLLQGSFPELLPAGPAAGRLRVPVWWPTQANRQGDGGPLGPQVVDGLQLLLRGGARRQESASSGGEAAGKTLFF